MHQPEMASLLPRVNSLLSAISRTVAQKPPIVNLADGILPQDSPPIPALAAAGLEEARMLREGTVNELGGWLREQIPLWSQQGFVGGLVVDLRALEDLLPVQGKHLGYFSEQEDHVDLLLEALGSFIQGHRLENQVFRVEKVKIRNWVFIRMVAPAAGLEAVGMQYIHDMMVIQNVEEIAAFRVVRVDAPKGLVYTLGKPFSEFAETTRLRLTFDEENGVVTEAYTQQEGIRVYPDPGQTRYLPDMETFDQNGFVAFRLGGTSYRTTLPYEGNQGIVLVVGQNDPTGTATAAFTRLGKRVYPRYSDTSEEREAPPLISGQQIQVPKGEALRFLFREPVRITVGNVPFRLRRSRTIEGALSLIPENVPGAGMRLPPGQPMTLGGGASITDSRYQIGSNDLPIVTIRNLMGSILLELVEPATAAGLEEGKRPLEEAVVTRRDLLKAGAAAAAAAALPAEASKAEAVPEPPGLPEISLKDWELVSELTGIRLEKQPASLPEMAGIAAHATLTETLRRNLPGAEIHTLPANLEAAAAKLLAILPVRLAVLDRDLIFDEQQAARTFPTDRVPTFLLHRSEAAQLTPAVVATILRLHQEGKLPKSGLFTFRLRWDDLRRETVLDLFA